MMTAAYIALAIVLTAVLYIVWGLRVKNGISYRSAIFMLIAAVFAGLVIIGFPLSFNTYHASYPNAGLGWIWFAALFQSMQNALRTFVLDGSWSELLASDSGDMVIPMFATTVGLTLNIVAPLLTFSAILTLFKEMTSRIRIRAMAASSRPLFMFSELNKDTIFLAEDIRRHYPKSNLVYTDVFPEEEEASYELKESAARLHAVMLRTDITQLDIKRKGSLTEYFLFGHDEDENVEQARKLYERNKNCTNTGIYVMSVQKGNELILDSLTASLNEDTTLSLAASGDWDYETMKDKVRNGGIVKLRRVDTEKQTAWREIPKMDCIRDAFAKEPDGRQRTLSLLVFASTHLSFAFIKTLLWYCQSDRFRLELNIVYNDADRFIMEEPGTVDVKKLLESECPDIIRTNRMETEGDSFYDIEFVGRSEFESGGFQFSLGDTVKNGKAASPLIGRLLRTDAALVDRYTDGTTLESAAFVRTIFRRLGLQPEIYAVCADEDEALKDVETNTDIVTYKDESYAIRFIGRRGDTYLYENIRNTSEENLGFCQHIKWIDVSYANEQAEVKEPLLKRELLNYERHEYFRNASIVRAMYLRNAIADPDKELSEDEVSNKIENSELPVRIADDNTRFEWRLRFRPEYECDEYPDRPRDRWSCTCAKCLHRRELEHNRWNAYMRTEGYIPSPAGDVNEKEPLAKVHGNIVPFSELSQWDKGKDG